ncbi:MAG: ATP-binding protein, partial [Clostridia bacterium]|nr:ATP-binding protein [Clostridia bacterium]
EEFRIFGSSTETIAEELGVDLLGKMPIDINLAKMVDNGNFEMFDNIYLSAAAKQIDEKVNK